MLLIYVPRITNRLKYIFEFIFVEVLHQEFIFTTSMEEYVTFDGAKINYSKNSSGIGVYFESTSLLFEKGIESIELEFNVFEELPIFFLVHNKDSSLPFDPFAASFYLISRYEEYMPYVRDGFGRFQAESSISYKKNFLQYPVVDIWIKKIAKILQLSYPELKFPKSSFSFIPTIDINCAYKYKYKGIVRSIGGMFRNIGRFDFMELIKQFRVLFRMEKDPFDTYEEQIKVHRENNIQTLYFILFANYASNDKNISVNNRKFQVLIKSIADYCHVGIHSSFASAFFSDKLLFEIQRFGKILNREIFKCRQHFLYLNMPLVYRNFLNCDIYEDYSMGYVNTPGFRAGTSRAFYFFDLDYDRTTKLKVFPFSFTDSALRNGFSQNTYRDILQRTRDVGGSMILLWNNEVFCEDFYGKKGITVYEDLIKLSLKME